MGAKMQKRWLTVSPLEFKEIVESSPSCYAIYKNLGYKGNADRAKIEIRAEACRDFGISISTDHLNANKSHNSTDAMILNEERTARTGTSILRWALTQAGRKEECESCGQGSVWNGKRLVLDIDHINGNFQDNRIENLRYLCANCHKQEDTSSQNAHAAWILHHMPEAVMPPRTDSR